MWSPTGTTSLLRQPRKGLTRFTPGRPLGGRLYPETRSTYLYLYRYASIARTHRVEQAALGGAAPEVFQAALLASLKPEGELTRTHMLAEHIVVARGAPAERGFPLPNHSAFNFRVADNNAGVIK